MVRERIRQIVKYAAPGLTLSSMEIRLRSAGMPGLLLEPGRKNRAACRTDIGRCRLPGLRCIGGHYRFEVTRQELHSAPRGGSSRLVEPDNKSEYSTLHVAADKSYADGHAV